MKYKRYDLCQLMARKDMKFCQKVNTYTPGYLLFFTVTNHYLKPVHI